MSSDRKSKLFNYLKRSTKQKLETINQTVTDILVRQGYAPSDVTVTETGDKIINNRGCGEFQYINSLMQMIMTA